MAKGIYKRLTPDERFVKYTNKTDTCWEWTGSKNKLGYGQMSDGKRVVLAHRFSFNLYKGDLGHKMSVCHTCDNPGCVNPDHLWLGTHKENMRDRNLKGRLANSKWEANGRAKLNRELVREIRALYKTGDFSHTGLAEMYNVSKASIYYVVKEKNWAI